MSKPFALTVVKFCYLNRKGENTNDRTKCTKGRLDFGFEIYTYRWDARDIDNASYNRPILVPCID